MRLMTILVVVAVVVIGVVDHSMHYCIMTLISIQTLKYYTSTFTTTATNYYFTHPELNPTLSSNTILTL